METQQVIKFADDVGSQDVLPSVGMSTETVEETLKRRKTITHVCYDRKMIQDMIDQAIEENWKKHQVIRIIKIKEETYETRKDLVNKLVHENKSGITTTEIAERLGIDPELVLRILMELNEEGKIGKINEGD